HFAHPSRASQQLPQATEISESSSSVRYDDFFNNLLERFPFRWNRARTIIACPIDQRRGSI
ncbi:MAG TPA: hypothetical protein VKY24_15125, partial [Reyranella sp.]|nr:hypothetical protein [Reyranella sp.]